MNKKGRDWFRALFDADTAAPDFYEKFELYAEHGFGLVLPPWWPPLSEVWAVGAEPPDTWGGGADRWQAAYDYLQRLNADRERVRAK
jgi:hypothetical protein